MMCQRISASIKPRAAGFTLVEVMVALAIVAVALPALLTLMSTQSNNTAHIRDRTLAEWVASNELNKQRLNFQLTQRALNGRATGTHELGGIEWHWVALGQVTAVEEIRRIEIAVGKDPEAAANNPLTTVAGFVYDQ